MLEGQRLQHCTRITRPSFAITLELQLCLLAHDTFSGTYHAHSNKSGLAKDHVLVDEQLKTPAHQARIWQVRNFRIER